jgi:hypothetical protein
MASFSRPKYNRQTLMLVMMTGFPVTNTSGNDPNEEMAISNIDFANTGILHFRGDHISCCILFVTITIKLNKQHIAVTNSGKTVTVIFVSEFCDIYSKS